MSEGDIFGVGDMVRVKGYNDDEDYVGEITDVIIEPDTGAVTEYEIEECRFNVTDIEEMTIEKEEEDAIHLYPKEFAYKTLYMVAFDARFREKRLPAMQKVYTVACDVYEYVKRYGYYFVRDLYVTHNPIGIYFSLVTNTEQEKIIFTALIEDKCDLTESERSDHSIRININDTKANIEDLAREAINHHEKLKLKECGCSCSCHAECRPPAGGAGIQYVWEEMDDVIIRLTNGCDVQGNITHVCYAQEDEDYSACRAAKKSGTVAGYELMDNAFYPTKLIHSITHIHNSFMIEGVHLVRNFVKWTTNDKVRIQLVNGKTFKGTIAADRDRKTKNFWISIRYEAYSHNRRIGYEDVKKVFWIDSNHEDEEIELAPLTLHAEEMTVEEEEDAKFMNEYVTVEEFTNKVLHVLVFQTEWITNTGQDKILPTLRKVHTAVVEVYKYVSRYGYYMVHDLQVTHNPVGIYFNLTAKGQMIFTAWIEDKYDSRKSIRKGHSLLININDTTTDIKDLVREAINNE